MKFLAHRTFQHMYLGNRCSGRALQIFAILSSEGHDNFYGSTCSSSYRIIKKKIVSKHNISENAARELRLHLLKKTIGNKIEI